MARAGWVGPTGNSTLSVDYPRRHELKWRVELEASFSEAVGVRK